MAEEIKAKAVETEELSMQEKEEVVQKNAGFDEESQMYKVDLTQPPKQQENAVQEQKTEDGVLRGSSEDEKDGEEAKVKLQEVQQEKVEEPVLEEVIEEEVSEEPAPVAEEKQPEQEVEQVEETKEPEVNLPENIQ